MTTPMPSIDRSYSPFLKISAVTVLALFLALSGCSKKSEGNSSSQSASSSSGEYTANVSKVTSVQKGEGAKVADFSWTDETGKKISFAEFSKDNVVLINFWATWCGPCKRELPDLVSLRDEYKDKSIKILGISLDQDGDVVNVEVLMVAANEDGNATGTTDVPPRSGGPAPPTVDFRNP